MIILAIVRVFPNFHVWLQKARFVYKSATMPFGGPFSASPAPDDLATCQGSILLSQGQPLGHRSGTCKYILPDLT